ncbi:hypothetical protein MMC25_003704 [Agyrium rufum]|nr:hypothetical protein [Agyrium rufum]
MASRIYPTAPPNDQYPQPPDPPRTNSYTTAESPYPMSTHPANGQTPVDPIPVYQAPNLLPIEHSTPGSSTPSGGRRAGGTSDTSDGKCDENGPPCKACSALDIPCTFERPSRRRGPPNRHAEAMKRQRMHSPISPGQSSPTSPTSAYQTAETLASFAQQNVLSAESILPFPILLLLIDDYFTYIHPVIPMPHEPLFRDRLRRREDLTNPKFLALLAAMIGALVASFPRKPQKHLRAQGKANLYPNSMSLVEKCYHITMEARGPGYLGHELTVYDAITSYLVGIVGAYTFNWRRCRLYFGECLNMIRAMGLHKSHAHHVNQSGLRPSSREMQHTESVPDYIEQEMARRLFWVLFVGQQSIQQLGPQFGELILLPPTPTENYPPLPMEVDDQYIHHTHVQQQPPGVISKLVGFNINVTIYCTYTSITTMELTQGIDVVFDWERQKHALEQSLQAAKESLHGVPVELLLVPSSWSQQSQHQPAVTQHRPGYYRPPPTTPGNDLNSSTASSNPYPSVKTEEGMTSQEAQVIAYEIQKANIYGSHLATRSYIVEKYWTLHDLYLQQSQNGMGGGGEGNNGRPSSNHGSHNIRSPTALDPRMPPPMSAQYTIDEDCRDSTGQAMARERGFIIQDLLGVLSSLSQVNMEPNGRSFIDKIRLIASTLLDVPSTRRSLQVERAQVYLSAFLDVLVKLERMSPDGRGMLNGSGPSGAGGGGDMGGTEDEDEAELGAWADLREEQDRFLRNGGFAAHV